MAERGRFGREVPEGWREAWNSWVGQLDLGWLTIEKLGGPDRHLIEKIAHGKQPTARLATLRRMSDALPIGEEERFKLSRLLGIQGLQRSFGDIAVEWRGISSSLGGHVEEIAYRVGLRTGPQYQALADIILPRIESVAQAIYKFGPRIARRLPI